jgi:hypothetical protein
MIQLRHCTMIRAQWRHGLLASSANGLPQPPGSFVLSNASPSAPPLVNPFNQIIRLAGVTVTICHVVWVAYFDSSVFGITLGVCLLVLETALALAEG